MTRGQVAGLLAVALLLTGCASQSTPVADERPAQRPPAVGPCPELPRAQPVEGGLPAFTLPCLGDGPDVRLSDLRGVPTVVNVWAAWCTTCASEMPRFAEAVTHYGERVRFFGIHYKASRGAGLASQGDFGVPFPSVHDEDGDRIVRALGAYAPPQTFFVDAAGKVVGREIGEITSQAEMTELVQQYLGVGA